MSEQQRAAEQVKKAQVASDLRSLDSIEPQLDQADQFARLADLSEDLLRAPDQQKARKSHEIRLNNTIKHLKQLQLMIDRLAGYGLPDVDPARMEKAKLRCVALIERFSKLRESNHELIEKP